MRSIGTDRVALVGLPAESLDLIPRVRRSGRGEVCLMAHPDPASRAHALAAVFSVPATPLLERVEEAGCNLLILPDLRFGEGQWQQRWSRAGLRWITEEEAWKYFTEVSESAPAADTGALMDAAKEEATPMSSHVMDAAAETVPGSHTSLYPTSLRATATHMGLLLEEQRASTDATWGCAYVWDEILGELVSASEVATGETAERRPGEWAERWVHRAWSERKPAVFQESPLASRSELPQRSRALIALPLGGEGVLFLEDAWIPTDAHSPDRDALAEAAQRWAMEVQDSRTELQRVARQRMQDQMGRAVYELLPEGDTGDPWPAAARCLVELLDADLVMFQFSDRPSVSTVHPDPAWISRLEEFVAGRSEEALQALPILAARARTPEGQLLRASGIGSLVVAGRGSAEKRVVVAAVRQLGSGKDEFHLEHLSALKKFLTLSDALSRGA